MNNEDTIQQQADTIRELQRKLATIENLIPNKYLSGCSTTEQAVYKIVIALHNLTAKALDLRMELSVAQRPSQELIDIDDFLGVLKQLCGGRLEAVRKIYNDREDYRRANIDLQHKLEEAEKVIEEVRHDRDSWKDATEAHGLAIHSLRSKTTKEIEKLQNTIVSLENQIHNSNTVDPVKYDKLWKEVAHLRTLHGAYGKDQVFKMAELERLLDETKKDANKWRLRFEIEQGKNAGRAQHEEMLRRKRDESDTKYKALCQTLVVLEKKLAHWNKVGNKIRGMVSEGELDGPEEASKVRKFRYPGLHGWEEVV